MNGSGTPVIGNSPITIPIFSTIWNKNIPAIPAAIYEPKSSLAVFATYIAFVIKIKYKTITSAAIINPISSPIAEYIKSVVCGYKYPS